MNGSLPLAATLTTCLVFSVPSSAAELETISFGRDILPILSNHCFQCHGPDEKAREGELRLDTRAGVYSVLEVGNSEESELMLRVTSQDEDEQMPPKALNKPLRPAQIKRLQQWIDSGARWGEHWSFEPLLKPAVPPPAKSPGVFIRNAPIRNAIDAFVQAKLVAAGMKPSPEASKRTLLRRVTFDVTGLPPTPAQLHTFLNDDSEDAYERAVDRLLQSPAYGERMAWDWLDAARYADSNGYQGDGERTMWPWRDWVIDAFNRNLRYDDFTVYQLAGDLLPGATLQQKLATGFCRNHMINGEGGRIPEENRVDYVMDMTETMGTIWLGLTVNCCRCHDHKYDPLSQRDYYRLFAFFNQTPVDGGGGNPQTPPVMAVATGAAKRRIAALEATRGTLERRRAQRAQELLKQQETWEQERLAAPGNTAWTLLKPMRAEARHQNLQVQPDGSILAGGPKPDNDTYTLNTQPPISRVTAIRLEALQHESHTNNGLARSDSGNFVLTELELDLRETGKSEPQSIKIGSAKATFEQGAHKITAAFDGKPQTGWAVYEGRPLDRSHHAVFYLAEPLTVAQGATLTITLRHDSPHVHHNLGRFRLSVSERPSPPLNNSDDSLADVLRIPRDRRNKQQAATILTAHQTSDSIYRQIQEEIKQTDKQVQDTRKSLPKVMVMQDLPKRRTTHVLVRGLYNKPDSTVSAGVPAHLSDLPVEAPASRLDLAKWLVADQNPLTARVTVNRFWQQLFGIGLVKTTEDFGVQGEIPQHRELLDWLAADFRDHDWDVKRLLRLILTSHTYRQSSKSNAASGSENTHSLDPQNRLLARGARFRMPAWMIRDQALAVSGLRVWTQGGPPVNGYQPAGVWEDATFGKKTYRPDRGAALYRRSLYTFWRRIISPTIFFDSASRQTCTVKVLRTNTPLHALLTFNDVTYVEAARVIAERTLSHRNASDAEQLDEIYLRILARKATKREQAILLGGLKRSRHEYEQEPAAAAKLLQVGEFRCDAKIAPTELAAWTALCLAILNLDETLSKE